ncbi:MAG: DUF1622 domain-containing protein [Burkholderiales bacterium]|nr:DUF1622 domain-containing protein [Burkholderiales bacterium]
MESGIGAVEELARQGILWLKLAVEVAGALAIAAGLVATVVALAGAWRRPDADGFDRARLTFARYLALALELQLGADILATAVAPSWDQLGKLAAIAVIRTALNHFLQRELRAGAAAAPADRHQPREG